MGGAARAFLLLLPSSEPGKRRGYLGASMRRICGSAILSLSLLCFVFRSLPVDAQSAIEEPISFETNPAPTVRLAKITATLYLPRASRPVSAMVIISSSGGVIDWIENYYARELARHGIAGLVVDSFGPRGVRRVIEDQSLVTSWDMENDAFAALAVLTKDSRIDGAHIGVMGLSKGGLVAQNSAFTIRREWRRTGSLAFAAHVAIAPDCIAQHRQAATTGKPVLYMLAELDDADPVEPCLSYVERIKAAGNPNVEVKIYKGANHNWEAIGRPAFLAGAENYSKCPAIIEDNGDWVMKAGDGPVLRSAGAIFEWRRANCRTFGEHVGGGSQERKDAATNDLIAFLKRNGF
jgi:dienelactone hydrolase